MTRTPTWGTRAQWEDLRARTSTRQAGCTVSAILVAAPASLFLAGLASTAHGIQNERIVHAAPEWVAFLCVAPWVLALAPVAVIFGPQPWKIAGGVGISLVVGVILARWVTVA